MSEGTYHRICMDATKWLYRGSFPMIALSFIATVVHMIHPDKLMYVKYGPSDIAARPFQVILCVFVLLMAAQMVSWTEKWNEQFNNGFPPSALTFCLVTLLLLIVMPFLAKYWALLVSLVLTSVLSMNGACRLRSCRQNGGTKATRLELDDYKGIIWAGIFCFVLVVGGYIFVRSVYGQTKGSDVIVCLSPLCLLVPRSLMGSKVVRERKGFDNYLYFPVFSAFIFIAIAVQLGVGCLSSNSNAIAAWADTVKEASQAVSAAAPQPTSQPSPVQKLDEYIFKLWGFVAALGLLGLIGYKCVFPRCPSTQCTSKEEA